MGQFFGLFHPSQTVVYEVKAYRELGIMISDFPSKKLYNPGGYTYFAFTPIYNVLTYPMISAGQAVVPVGFISGATWLTGYSTPGTIQFTEEGVFDANGKYYNLTVAGFAPGDKPELIDLMDSMAVQKHLVVVKDSLGIYRLIGSPAVAMDFTSSFDSGAQKSGLKGFTFKFTGTCLYRAPVYNP